MSTDTTASADVVSALDATDPSVQSADPDIDTGGQGPAEAEDAEVDTGDEAALGDAGQRALSALRDQVKDLKAELADYRASAGDRRGLDRLQQERAELEELRAFKAQAEGRLDEHEAEVQARRVREEVLGEANKRILSAEVRAAATGKMNNPATALKLIDLERFEVGEDGSVDRDAIATAIDELLETEPGLAARRGPKSPKPDPSQGPEGRGAASTADQFAQAIGGLI